jgi:hypothetical protein
MPHVSSRAAERIVAVGVWSASRDVVPVVLDGIRNPLKTRTHIAPLMVEDVKPALGMAVGPFQGFVSRLVLFASSL